MSTTLEARERRNARERAKRAELRARANKALIIPAGKAVITLPAVPQPDFSKSECRKHDPDLWFPVTPRDSEEAIRICADCPVARMCREWATATGQRYGIWGGTDFEQIRERRTA